MKTSDLWLLSLNFQFTDKQNKNNLWFAVQINLDTIVLNLIEERVDKQQRTPLAPVMYELAGVEERHNQQVPQVL